MRLFVLYICFFFCSICLHAQWDTIHIGESGLGSDIYKHIDFYDDSNGLIVGWNSDVLITHDQGSTWEPNWGLGYQEDFEFREGGDAIILHTTGAFDRLNIFTYNFEYLFSPTEDYEAYTLEMLNDTIALVGAKHGIFLVDIKRGYETVWPGGSRHINSICRISDSSFYAFGGRSYYNNILLRSMDNGSSWDTVNPDAGIEGTLFLKHEDTLFIASWDGIYRSVNAGIDWAKMNCFPDTFNMNFRDLTFSDALNGYAVGGGTMFPEIRPSNIYKTTDGGENWFRQYYAQHGGIYSVYFLTDSLGFSCGENLYILGTENGGGIGVGISTPVLNGNFCQIYPNPAGHCVNIRYPISDIRYSVLIYDMTGRQMDEIIIPPGQEESRIDVSSYPAGMYYAVLRSEEGISVIRLIKQ